MKTLGFTALCHLLVLGLLLAPAAGPAFANNKNADAAKMLQARLATVKNLAEPDQAKLRPELDGFLLCEDSTGRIFIVVKGELRHFPDPKTYRQVIDHEPTFVPAGLPLEVVSQP